MVCKNVAQVFHNFLYVQGISMNVYIETEFKISQYILRMNILKILNQILLINLSVIQCLDYLIYEKAFQVILIML